MENLKDFMLLFRMEMDSIQQPSHTELAVIKKSWVDWIGVIALNARLVSSHQLGFESAMVRANKKKSPGFITTENKSISGNLVLKALSLDEATKYAQQCPILAIGGNVEVRNILTNY